MRAIDYLAPVLEDVKGYFARFGCERGVEFVPGFFEETLEGLSGHRWSVVRLDADGYAATRLALDVLYPGLSVGGYVIIDDYFHPHLGVCRRAVDEYRAQHGIEEPIERIDWVGARWRRESAVPSRAPGEPPAGGFRPSSPPVASERTGQRIPTEHELQLQNELAELQTRLDAATEELARARRSPLAKLSPRNRRQTP
jgi:hypothetical protein